MTEIWLSNGTKDKLLLPVNPEQMGYTDNRNNSDIILADGDEKTVIGGRNQRDYTITSTFPIHRPYYATTSSIWTPITYIRKLKTWMDNREVLMLQVTGTNINEAVTIRTLEWNEIGGTGGDIDYTLTLKEYEPISATKVTSSTSATKKASTRPASKKIVPKSYTVVPGDSLWKIAKKFYGDGTMDSKIYARNKSAIGPNPNLIYPGQRLVIP